MRYEDLKINPRPALEGLFCFLLDVPSIAGTVVERRISEVTASGFEAKSAYKLKDTTNNLSRANHMYTEEQMNTIKTELDGFIKFWRYDQSSVGEETPTNFFDIIAEAGTETYACYNSTKTLPKCGQMSSDPKSFDIVT